MKIILAQLNYIVGDIEGNLNKILDVYKENADKEALMIFTELALTGYYPQDLVTKDSFLERQDNAFNKLVEATDGKSCGIVIGYIAKNKESKGKPLFNALALISDGKQVFEYHKKLLPTYNVFDEQRHFSSGNKNSVFEYKGRHIGFLICEDAWAKTNALVYKNDPVADLKSQPLDLVISINASPNNLGKMDERIEIMSDIAKQLNVPVFYVNQIGGNDELVFDGRSFAITKMGRLSYQMDAFKEQVLEIKMRMININDLGLDFQSVLQSNSELILNQTVLGIRDYVKKCGFNKVVIGSSGGIDSAVTLAICVEALGSENVMAITMPSKFSSEGSVNDSVDLCKNLNVKLLTASIAEEFELSVKRFKKMSGEKPSDLTQENIQARIRGRILMEYSNHFGALVISTGNKSEMSVGYATLYGDMNGGVNPLGDLYKMEVYDLAKYINEKSEREIIPISIIEKEPSAELSEDQKDSDSLPEYPLLDAILKLYIEGDLLDAEESNRCKDVLNKLDVSQQEIKRIQQMVDRAEFKRRQAPPIIRVQKRSFGMGRWLPVAAKY